jgi:hypothetical protein
VASDPTQSIDGLEAAASGGPEQADAELLALPAPPKRERALTIALMLLTCIASALLAWSLRSEARYALSHGAPVDIGGLRDFTDAGSESNRYVRATGLLGTKGAIRYGRAAEGDSYRLAPVAGNDLVWVEIRVPEGFEGPLFIPPGSFAGRLVPLDQAGLRHGGLRRSVQEKTGVTIPDRAWILIDGSSPRTSRWALALVVLFAGFSLWNLLGVAKLVARVRDRQKSDSDSGDRDLVGTTPASEQ